VFSTSSRTISAGRSVYDIVYDIDSVFWVNYPFKYLHESVCLNESVKLIIK